MDRPSYLPPPTRWIIRIHQLTATISLRRMHATRLLIHEGTKTGGAFAAFARKITSLRGRSRRIGPSTLGTFFVSTTRWAWILETGLSEGDGAGAASWKV